MLFVGCFLIERHLREKDTTNQSKPAKKFFCQGQIVLLQWDRDQAIFSFGKERGDVSR